MADLTPMLAHSAALDLNDAQERLDAAGVEWELVDCGDGDVWLKPTMGVPITHFTGTMAKLEPLATDWMLRPDPRPGAPA